MLHTMNTKNLNAKPYATRSCVRVCVCALVCMCVCVFIPVQLFLKNPKLISISIPFQFISVPFHSYSTHFKSAQTIFLYTLSIQDVSHLEAQSYHDYFRYYEIILLRVYTEHPTDGTCLRFAFSIFPSHCTVVSGRMNHNRWNNGGHSFNRRFEKMRRHTKFMTPIYFWFHYISFEYSTKQIFSILSSQFHGPLLSFSYFFSINFVNFVIHCNTHNTQGSSSNKHLSLHYFTCAFTLLTVFSLFSSFFIPNTKPIAGNQI